MCAAVILAAGAARADDRPTLLHTAPTQADPDTPLQVEGTLVGVNLVTRVFIRFRGPGEEYGEADMELQYGDLYRGSIPAQKLTAPGVEYYVEGLQRSGERVPIFKSAQKPARVFVQGGTAPPDKPARRTGNTPQERPRRDTKKPPLDDPQKPKVVEDGEDPPVDELPGGRLEDDGDGENEERPSFGDEPPAESDDEDSSSDDSELAEDLALYTAVDTVALATRHAEKVTRVPAIASSFSRAQIRALGARSVYDVLDVVPGLTISRDVQGFHRTAIRGIRSEPEVLFLLNGHPLNNVFDGRALANLPIENIDRIEVVRGPGSSLYGTGAFLGVVNVVTAADEDAVRLAASGGSFGSLDGHLDVAKRFSSVRVFLDADVARQDGYRKPVLQDALNSETIQQDLRTELEPAGYTNDSRFFINVGGGARVDTGAGGELGLSVRYMNERRAALIGLFDTVGHPDSSLGWQVILADLTWRKLFGQKTTIQARAFFDDQQTDRLFQLTPHGFESGADVYASGLKERTRIGTRTFGIDAGADIQLVPSNRLSFGAVVQLAALTGYAYETNFLLDESENISEYLDGTFQRPTEALKYPQEIGNGSAASRLILGLYAQDQWTIVDRLTLTFGFRLDATELPTVDENLEINGKAFVPSFNPRAGLVWAVSDPLVLKLLYGRAFRSPTVQELAEEIPSADFNQGRFQGNPRLDPATVDTVELGADLVQAAGDARVRIRGNVFYESFTNPIAAVDDTGNVVPLRNRTGVRVWGAEAEARLEASERANAWVNASWFRAFDLDASLQLLTDTPQLRVNAGMSMPIGRYLNFDLLAKVGVERRNDARSALEYTRRYRLPTYTLIGAQLRTEKLFDHLELALNGTNLLNFDYADDAPRPDRMPGMIPREGLGVFLTIRGEL